MKDLAEEVVQAMANLKDYNERLRGVLAELSQERRADLLHLLSCPICLPGARESLKIAPEPGPPEPPPPHVAEYGGLLTALESRVPALVQQMEEQRAAARRLLDALLAHPAERQLALARGAEFRSLDLADLLLEDSADARPEDPARAEGLALLALPILYQRHPRKSAERIADLKARALVLLGNARRLQGDLLEADERFREAAFHLTGPPDSIDRALYCQMLAALRRDQHREDEAVGLLLQAANLYRNNGDLLGNAACTAELGFLYLDQDQVHEAFCLAQTVPILDLGRDFRLAVRARLALAVCQARLGYKRPARNQVEDTRPFYSHLTSSAEMAQVAWMEGKVALLTGDREDAATLLETARKGFLSAGNLYDAALASLDLVLALPKARRRAEEVHPLLHEIVERFPADLDRDEAVKALGAVEMAAAGLVHGGLEKVVALAAERLRRVRRYPQLRFPRPHLPVRPDREEAPRLKA
jgi:tetratricopeptide (TPR) repeat protein